ncbi:MAG: HYR domain-containing protein, partial [Salegentibacter mishustinae]|nr:HYR domain-containing protein [Salegentibacter mishustinae]
MGKITPRIFLAVFIFGLYLLSENTVLANIKYGPEKPISEKKIQDKSFFVGFLLEEEPTITAPSDINGVNKPGECFALKSNINLGNATFSGSSNSPTNDAPTEFPVGSTTVTWTVTDDSGNTATDTQLVNITDSENP